MKSRKKTVSMSILCGLIPVEGGPFAKWGRAVVVPMAGGGSEGHVNDVGALSGVVIGGKGRGGVQVAAERWSLGSRAAVEVRRS